MGAILFILILFAIAVFMAIELLKIYMFESYQRRLRYLIDEVIDEVHKVNTTLTIIDFRLREIADKAGEIADNIKQEEHHE